MQGDLSALLASESGSEQDPAQIVEQRERIELLLASLNERQRRVIELRLLGHSTADAARMMGVKANVLRAQLSELRQQLRQAGLLTAWI